MSKVVASLHNVTKTYFAGHDSEVTALKNISIDFKSGEWVYVVGDNGSGKSTLLKILAGELKASNGSLLFNNFSKDVCFLEQGTANNLVPSMTVYENLSLFMFSNSRLPSLRFYRSTPRINYCKETLSKFKVGLENRIHTTVSKLSGGQQQAVVAARAMIQSPLAILADEFTSALDKRIAPYIVQQLRNYIRKRDGLAVTVTHDYHEVEKYADRVLVISRGELVADLRKMQESDLSAHRIMEMVYD